MLAIELLDRITLLKGLDGATLERLSRAMRHREYHRRETVIHKGSVGEDLLFLLDGRLQVIDVTSDGREVGIHFIGPGDYFGELSIIDGQPRSASVVASSPSGVAFLGKAIAQELFYSHPVVAERLIKRMAQIIRLSSANRAILSLPRAFQRVYALLNNYVRPNPGGLMTIDRMPTQAEIASMANTSRETVSRALGVLIQHHIIEKDLRRLIVRKPDELRRASVPVK
jgi:CRP/FNR family cyclic AMP-dependent transcriptional regulator